MVAAKGATADAGMLVVAKPGKPCGLDVRPLYAPTRAP